jgi:hypothetical protein
MMFFDGVLLGTMPGVPCSRKELDQWVPGTASPFRAPPEAKLWPASRNLGSGMTWDLPESGPLLKQSIVQPVLRSLSITAQILKPTFL